MEEIDEKTRVEDIIEQLKQRFENIAEIHVHHFLTATNASDLLIKVHAGDAESFEQYLDEFADGKKAIVDAGGEDPLTLPVSVMATFDGPGNMQSSEGTTIYMGENVIGAEPRSTDDGLRRLKEKLSGTCPCCRESVESFSEHYRQSRDCWEDEQL